ncbi:DUF4402 domain-containing protein [Chitinophaga sp. SYP-B3965]|uniref:DUF4402 domain-containing protein n=1 Tax=Chitinophaga sp. SYP-B3965 TaxID=2663120 RepID=UPI00129978AD|nr:DUF4402 domain-containing protein [Chitinophaga sp. SYP-B3965]MRG48141.1 DUF4402 domain-containing protein [Chitinophaga sp. SYP-B3965]
MNNDKILLFIGKLTVWLLCCTCFSVQAQQPPPRPIAIYVNPAQGLIFGAFFQGVSGGTVIVYADGSRSVTGSIVQANLGFPFSPAIFEVDANPGTLITILNGPDITLSGSNGGSLHLHLGAASTGSPFVATAISPGRTQIRIGGTLTVGSPLANPAGSYSGSFLVTFIQE